MDLTACLPAKVSGVAEHRRFHVINLSWQINPRRPDDQCSDRLIVRASIYKSKQFVWEILDDSDPGQCVQASKRTFRSMEDAYNIGKGALEYWQQKTRRTHPPVDLAQATSGRKLVDRDLPTQGL
jgi:hypothetical protein